MSWVASLFCEHRFGFVKSLYGDEPEAHGKTGSLWQCPYCDKKQVREGFSEDSYLNEDSTNLWGRGLPSHNDNTGFGPGAG